MRTKVISDKIEGRGVMLNLSIETGQVEAVKNVILFNLAEILIAFV